MSSLKISDPNKRDFIVEEFLKTKKNIQDSYLSERLGDIDIHRENMKGSVQEQHKCGFSSFEKNAFKVSHILLDNFTSG